MRKLLKQTRKDFDVFKPYHSFCNGRLGFDHLQVWTAFRQSPAENQYFTS